MNRIKYEINDKDQLFKVLLSVVRGAGNVLISQAWLSCSSCVHHTTNMAELLVPMNHLCL